VDADRDALEAAGVPTFETPERAANAAGVLARYARLHADDPATATTDGGRVPSGAAGKQGGHSDE